jgi:hypothetical protein
MNQADTTGSALDTSCSLQLQLHLRDLRESYAFISVAPGELDLSATPERRTRAQGRDAQAHPRRRPLWQAAVLCFFDGT